MWPRRREARLWRPLPGGTALHRRPARATRLHSVTPHGLFDPPLKLTRRRAALDASDTLLDLARADKPVDGQSDRQYDRDAEAHDRDGHAARRRDAVDHRAPFKVKYPAISAAMIVPVAAINATMIARRPAR